MLPERPPARIAKHSSLLVSSGPVQCSLPRMTSVEHEGPPGSGGVDHATRRVVEVVTCPSDDCPGLAPMSGYCESRTLNGLLNQLRMSLFPAAVLSLPDAMPIPGRTRPVSTSEMPDPRRLVLDGPWDFLSGADKDEVLRATGPWDHLVGGLSMGSCLERPAGFDVVVTLDSRITNAKDLAPEPFVEHLPWNIADGHWPDLDELVSLAATIHDRLAAGKQVLVRCMAGLNRSGLVCASVLVRQGASPEDAIGTVRAARSRHALCNPRFVELVARMRSGDPRLGLARAETESAAMRARHPVR